MAERSVVLMWLGAVVVSIIVSIIGWVMGDVGLGFLGFLVRWIAPIGVLIGFSYYRKSRKAS